MHRPIAPGLIQGALRGLLAGAFTATFAGVAALLLDPREPELAIGAAVEIPIIATVLGAADGYEARRAPNPFVRLAAAIVGFALAATVVASVNELVFKRALAGEPTAAVAQAALYGALLGIPLGISAAVAGPHERGASAARRFRRALRGAALPALVLAGLIPFDNDRWWYLLAAVSALAIAVIHATGHLIVRPLGRWVGRWLEPDSWSVRLEAREEYGKLAADVLRLRELVETAHDERARLSATERGLEAARSAFDVAERARLELVREEAGRQLRWFLRALGRDEEARSLKV